MSPALRIRELEAALRPFGDAFRYLERFQSEFMREQFLTSMTVSKSFSEADLARAAALTALPPPAAREREPTAKCPTCSIDWLYSDVYDKCWGCGRNVGHVDEI